jgi:dodecin
VTTRIGVFNFTDHGTKSSTGRFRSEFYKGGTPMPDHVYRIIEVAGSSTSSLEDAIQNAVGRASRTLRGISWFEVLQTRGQVEAGKLQYQVVLKVGFTLEEP